jgi:hypothetical protein
MNPYYDQVTKDAIHLDLDIMYIINSQIVEKDCTWYRSGP